MKLTSLKTWEDCRKHQLNDVTQAEVVKEVTGGQNTLLEYYGFSPNQALLGSNLRGFYEQDAQTESANSGAAETTPAYVEQQIRMRGIAKFNILKAVWEDRLAKASRSRPMQIDPSELKPKESPIDLLRIPERKDGSGWRGP